MSDDTGEFFPFRGEDEKERGNQPNDGPRKSDDETRILPSAASPEDEATRVYAPVRSGAWAEEDEIWEGRAGVRAPQPDETRTDWTSISPEEPRGRWWTPILVGILALVLLALLGWGIYLILQSHGNDGENSPAPAVTSAAVPSPEPTATTTTPKTEAPSTPPTTVPTTTTTTAAAPPSDVTIPALRGLSLDEARTALNRKNLNYRLRYVPSTDAPPGTIIGSDPAEGQQVPGDTIINLIIASEPTATATTPPPATGTTTPTYDED
ncbi:PASTA domain-containing protein [Actinoplanes sp. N902-109]|uniref:PASTA domain-containing protein n=1 Tax=Actinoplanes sp. (strain N902-109) TaxID=649831 RepID=UPI00032949D9|nr:PASTA domain-containing protein [Actinoplanes sp. N902-109]AGL13552.1 PASTA domain-containing protein [Actinoplanes sp. N902-109]